MDYFESLIFDDLEFLGEKFRRDLGEFGAGADKFSGEILSSDFLRIFSEISAKIEGRKLPEAVILAGGASERMRAQMGDKTLLKYKNFPTITHFLFWRLSVIFKSVKVAAKDEKFAKFSPPLPMILDNFSEFCPLGVLANLGDFKKPKNAQNLSTPNAQNFKNNEPIFVIAADMPFVRFSTIFSLFDALKNNKISIAGDESFTHFLCGFFRPSVAKNARDLLAQNIRSIRALSEICGAKITHFSPGQFKNINTKRDYRDIL